MRMNGELILGMVAAFAASAAYNVAIALQALEARNVPEEHGLRLSLLLRLLRRPRWLAGAALNFLGWPLQTVALLLAPLTLVQPCLAAGLLLLLAIGSRQLHEHVGRREVTAIAAIIVGVVVLAIASPHRSEGNAGAGTLIVVLGILGVLALLPYMMSRFRRATGLPVAISAGLAFAWSGISTKLLSDALSIGDWTGIIGWAAATGLAAALGTASEMTALQSRGATEVAPLVFVAQLLVPALLAPVLVQESWDSTPLGGLVLLIGLMIVSAGSFLLASSRIVQAITSGEPVTPAAGTADRSSRESSGTGSSRDAVDPGERGSQVTSRTGPR
jgi:drug/metabolite transporter (DMT)-like permease